MAAHSSPSAAARVVAFAGACSVAACASDAEPPGRSVELPPSLAAFAVRLPAPSVIPLPEPERRPSPRLTSIAPETIIYASPDPDSPRRGYLRAGAVVNRSAESAGKRGCPSGWYGVEPHGYVCEERGASLEVEHPIALAARYPPDRNASLPYSYALSTVPSPVLYVRLPTREQQRSREPGLDIRGHAPRIGEDELPSLPIPEWLVGGKQLPSLLGFVRHNDRLDVGEAAPHTGFAILGSFEWAARRFALTTELALVALDRTRLAHPSHFHGIELDGGVTLPVVFARGRDVPGFRRGEADVLVPSGALPRRTAIGVREGATCVGARCFAEALDGTLFDERELIRIERAPPPAELRPGERWIDVSLERQTLVAYEGERPVYATLVSSGVGGAGDSRTTHATLQGTFRIHTKHVSVTMGGTAASDTFDFQDVPWVQYFHGSYALHGVYWHDDFGVPHSHGCINLAPADAHRLFDWTAPVVPAAWHGAMSREGTLVSTHP